MKFVEAQPQFFREHPECVVRVLGELQAGLFCLENIRDTCFIWNQCNPDQVVLQKNEQSPDAFKYTVQLNCHNFCNISNVKELDKWGLSFVAPERIKKTSFNSQANMWILGALVRYMLAGDQESDPMATNLDQYLKETDPELLEIIAGLTHPEPLLRTTPRQLALLKPFRKYASIRVPLKEYTKSFTQQLDFTVTTCLIKSLLTYYHICVRAQRGNILRIVPSNIVVDVALQSCYLVDQKFVSISAASTDNEMVAYMPMDLFTVGYMQPEMVPEAINCLAIAMVSGMDPYLDLTVSQTRSRVQSNSLQLECVKFKQDYCEKIFSGHCCHCGAAMECFYDMLEGAIFDPQKHTRLDTVEIVLQLVLFASQNLVDIPNNLQCTCGGEAWGIMSAVELECLACCVQYFFQLKPHPHLTNAIDSPDGDECSKALIYLVKHLPKREQKNNQQPIMEQPVSNSETVKQNESPQTFEEHLATAGASLCKCGGKSKYLIQAARDGCVRCCATYINQVTLLVDDETALMRAVRKNHIQIVKLLLFKESRIQNSRGYTALMVAVMRNRVEMIRLLAPLEAKMQDKDGLTALMIAVKDACEAAVEELLPFESGVRDNKNWLAVMYAEAGLSKEIQDAVAAVEGALLTEQDAALVRQAVEKRTSGMAKKLTKQKLLFSE